jgi:uncharacterized protein
MKNCPICKVVTVLAGVGALNWGLVAFLNVNLVEKLLGIDTMFSKVVYGLVGLSGVILLVTLIKACPCMKKGTCS